MQSVYPEVISLRYANIPKTTIEGQCSGIQLIIEMSLLDNAANTTSAIKPSASAQSALKGNSTLTSRNGLQKAAAAPSSTRAVYKAGSTAIAVSNSNAAQSVTKTSTSNSAEIKSGEDLVPHSPSEPLHMMAVKAEFERRLEKQVRSIIPFTVLPILAAVTLSLGCQDQDRLRA